MGWVVCAKGAVRIITYDKYILKARPISHWTDNDGVLKVLARSGRGRRAVSSKLNCRDLWAEILGRICYWRDNRGDCCTSWVRRHVDSTDTEQVKWTRVEWGNVAADAMASSQLLEGRGATEARAQEGNADTEHKEDVANITITPKEEFH